MNHKSKTTDGRLEVLLFDSGVLEIESPDHQKVAIEIQRVDPTKSIPEGVKGALYVINTYNPENGDKTRPHEYGIAFIMPDGEILSRAGSYLK